MLSRWRVAFSAEASTQRWQDYHEKGSVMSQTDAALSQGAQGLKGVAPGRAAPAQSPQRRTITWLHVPALVFMLIMTQIPFVLAVWFSLHNWNLLQPAEGFPFVGLSNY